MLWIYDLKEWLAGRKTNIVGAVVVAYGLVYEGWHLGDWDRGLKTATFGLALLTGRAAIAKVERAL